MTKISFPPINKFHLMGMYGSDWFLKIQTFSRITFFRLNDVVLQRAVPATGRITALGIEQCRCPQEYSGLSCQVTAGFSSASFFIENNILKNTCE